MTLFCQGAPHKIAYILLEIVNYWRIVTKNCFSFINSLPGNFRGQRPLIYAAGFLMQQSSHSLTRGWLVAIVPASSEVIGRPAHASGPPEGSIIALLVKFQVSTCKTISIIFVPRGSGHLWAGVGGATRGTVQLKL